MLGAFFFPFFGIAPPPTGATSDAAFGAAFGAASGAASGAAFGAALLPPLLSVVGPSTMVRDDVSIAAASPLAVSLPSLPDAAADSLIVDCNEANDVCAPTPVPGVALSPKAFIASTALANLGPAVGAVVEAADKFKAGG